MVVTLCLVQLASSKVDSNLLKGRVQLLGSLLGLHLPLLKLLVQRSIHLLIRVRNIVTLLLALAPLASARGRGNLLLLLSIIPSLISIICPFEGGWSWLEKGRGSHQMAILLGRGCNPCFARVRASTVAVLCSFSCGAGSQGIPLLAGLIPSV